MEVRVGNYYRVKAPTEIMLSSNNKFILKSISNDMVLIKSVKEHYSQLVSLQFLALHFELIPFNYDVGL